MINPKRIMMLDYSTIKPNADGNGYVSPWVIYSSLTDASRVTGINIGDICLAAQGKRKTAGGFYWEYI